MMRTGAAGLALIKEFEGFRAKPYLCSAGYPTVGWGALRYLDGSLVRLDGPHVSLEDAEAMLRRDLAVGEAGVHRWISRALTQNQFDALTSFTFNLGPAALRSSMLRRCVNEGRDDEVPDQFKRWCFAGGRRQAGLLRRRIACSLLYMAG